MNKTISQAQPAHVEIIDECIVDFRDVVFFWDAAQNFSLNIPALNVARREKLLLIGPSGSGKSTLLSLATGIVTPRSGSVNILGQDLASFINHGRDQFRAEHFGIIFQMFNLLPYGSVLDNVILPLHFSRRRKLRTEEGGGQEIEARRLLTRLGIEPDIQDRTSTAELSVGQQQRVAAARALIGRPEIIVADEPTSALDRGRQLDFLELLFEEVNASQSTLIMVSHDESLGGQFDRVLHLDDIIIKTAKGKGK